MTELKVPLAYDGSRNLVWPTQAVKDESYFCPCCDEPVVFRSGDVRVHHFAHRPNGVCTGETITHKCAKLAIQNAVREWKAGKAGPPQIERHCRICDDPVPQPLPEKVTEAVLEHRVAEGFVIDVALLAGDETVAAVEVRVSHELDDLKKKNLSVPFIEVEGHEVLETPTKWLPITDRFGPLTCSVCRDAYRKFLALTRDIAARSRIEIPRSFYRYAPTSCWSCRADILVFTWPGHKMHSPDRELKQPVPEMVQFRRSQAADGEYWVSVCPFCDRIQGDVFMCAEPEGTFFGFECGPDTAEAFREDLVRLAHIAHRNGRV